MNANTSPRHDGSADGSAERPLVDPDEFANRTPIPELLDRFTSGGWPALGLTETQEAAVREHLDRIVAEAAGRQP